MQEALQSFLEWPFDVFVRLLRCFLFCVWDPDLPPVHYSE